MASRDQSSFEGRIIAGRFELSAKLGEGGMGEVYRAHQLDLGRDVALKLLKEGSATEEGARARFRREARVAAALRHPGAVQIYDFGDDEGRLFLAMELLEGPTLRERLRMRAEAPLTSAFVLNVAIQVSEVLLEAHRIGLIHRDLKPANIFVIPAPEIIHRVVVADFGLAFIPHRAETGRITREGLLTGTPAYLSPEQAIGHEIGPKSDLYSLGCTLYELIAGRPPFVDDSEVGVITKHLFGHPTPPTEEPQALSVPRAFERLILEMLSKHPEERPELGRLLSELRALAETPSGRERSRDARDLLERRERMLPEPPVGMEEATLELRTPTANHRPFERPLVRIALVGTIDEELRLGLEANNMKLEAIEASRARAGALVFAPRATQETLASLLALGATVITDNDAEDFDRLRVLIKAGVEEVIPQPLSAAVVERRLSRALRKAARRKAKP